MTEHERDWASWMRAANAGDAAAYRRLLEALSGFVRGVVRRRAATSGLTAAEVEDVVQETLLAIHLKRGTWDPRQPITPWVAAIARNKAIDALRRRGRRVDLPIEDFAELLPAAESEDGVSAREAERMLGALKGRQREVVQAITVDGESVRETASRLGVSEGAVRVALHRGLASLAAAYRDSGA